MIQKIKKYEKDTSVILTVHNQESIIFDVLGSIIQFGYLTIDEIVIVVDGCTDNSVRELLNAINFYFNVSTDKSTHLKGIRFIYADNVFETKANNLALRTIENPYCIIIQDDMIMNDLHFDVKLRNVLKQNPDIWAVSGRNAHNLDFDSYGLEILYPDTTGRGTTLIDPNKVYIREVVNRAPLMLDMEMMRKLNYFDEVFCPLTMDDHDVILRAWYKMGKKSAGYHISYFSNPIHGGTRKAGAEKWFYPTLTKNWGIMRERYQKLYSQGNKPTNEERKYINEL